MDTKPMVSVSLITYNQVEYIRRAIESIIAQKTNFKYEIIIGDDCSSDGTREVIIEYQQRYPTIIKPILHAQRNSGIPGKLNFVSTIYAAIGKYIALLDGDDYWDDPYKLQKQVDFLEHNPEYVISFHDSVVVDGKGKQLKESKLGKNRRRNLSREEIIYGSLIPANTVVFRNGLIKSFPEEFFSTLNGDTFTFALLGQYGKAFFQNNVNSSGYRVHNNGVWSIQSNYDRQLKAIQTYKQLLRVIKPQYKAVVKKRIFIKTVLFSSQQVTKKEKVRTYLASFKYFIFEKYTVKVALFNAYQLLKKY